MKKLLSIFITICMMFAMLTGIAAENDLMLSLQIGNPIMTVNGTEKPIDAEGTAPVILKDVYKRQTWCPPCRSEMPHIQELYQEYGGNSGDVVILGISNPKTAANPHAQDKSPEEITAFLKENNYFFPSLSLIHISLILL